MGQLFEPFNRLGREAGPQEGTGIGLVMSKRLVELMGGAIGVESTLGSGSVFWFDLNPAAAPTLPMNRAEDLETAHPMVQDAATMRTLLYIEDNPANLNLVDKLIARRPNLRLLTAAEGTAGIELARSSRPDVILMDINLPGINGFEVLTLLRQDQSTAHIPIVALSANAMPRDIEKGMRAGFFRYLTKPFRINQFMDTLDEALDFGITPTRILVVDDLPDNRLLIQSYLRSSPCEVTFAEDGQSALDRFSSSDFDLVLMDMQMPVMNGLEAAIAIRAIERERGAFSIPIIAVTSNDSLQEIEKERSAGCNAHLSKPISKTELLRVIEVNAQQLKSMPTEASASTGFPGDEVPTPKRVVLDQPASIRRDSSKASEVSPASDQARLADFGENLLSTARSHDSPDATRLGATIERSANEIDCHSRLNAECAHIDQVHLVEAEPERSSTPRVEPLDTDVLRKLKEDSDLTDLIEIFVASAPAMVTDMRRALGDSRAADMVMAAHKLKGSCSNFGASPLRELCARIEQGGINGNMNVTAHLIDSAENELHRLIEAFGPYRKPEVHQ